MDELNRARLESIVELSNDMLACIIDLAKTHGNDPMLTQIISSAITLTIRDLNKIAPGFTNHMKDMLEGEKDDK